MRWPGALIQMFGDFVSNVSVTVRDISGFYHFVVMLRCFSGQFCVILFDFINNPTTKQTDL